MPISKINTKGLGDSSVTAGKIDDGAVVTVEIADDAVTGAKIENNPTVAGNLATGGTLAIAGHGSIGNAGTVAGTRALTVVGATDGTSSSILVGYNSSLAQKFSVRDDGFATIGNGLSLTDGNLVVASGHGIDFSAGANAAGMTNELLDDYEEGTWTPTLGNVSAPTFTSRNGTYTKIGRIVYLTCEIIVASGLDTSDGSTMYIQGFPFTGNSTNESCVFSIGRISTLISNKSVVAGRFLGDGLALKEGGANELAYNECASSGTLQFACTYSTS